MSQDTILPENKKRQHEIIEEIVLLQNSNGSETRIERLQAELDLLMTERDKVKRPIAVAKVVDSIAKDIPFENLYSIHFHRMRDLGLTVKDIAEHFQMSRTETYAHFEKIGVLKK